MSLIDILLEKHGGDVFHYGVKGMRWGVRKDDPGGNRLRRLGKKSAPPASEDKARTDALKSRVHKGSPANLSNNELKDLVNRLNLEQQYSRLDPPKVNVGKRVALGIVKNAGDVSMNVVKQQSTRVANAFATEHVDKLVGQAKEELKKKNE